eukprot:5478055-Prymnesium_polylepis.1
MQRACISLYFSYTPAALRRGTQASTSSGCVGTRDACFCTTCSSTTRASQTAVAIEDAASASASATASASFAKLSSTTEAAGNASAAFAGDLAGTFAGDDILEAATEEGFAGDLTAAPLTVYRLPCTCCSSLLTASCT